ncbi:MAG: sugar ABC transporter substrate-binding protein [Firmicutes bacterium]|nr:sugar ABC transporter substrate-binding protein [Bacillota bacterium]
MKRFRTLLLMLALVLVLGTAGASAQRITVIMPRHEMDLIGLWEEQAHRFEQETGIQVELIQMSWDEVANKVLTDLAAGGTTYDVIEFDNGWVAKFAAADWVVPLNEFASQEYLDGILDGLLSTFTHDGQVLGIPWNNDTRFFFYNAEMLRQAGIAAPPQTWDEVVEQALKLKEQGIAYPIAEYWNQEWALANSIAFYLYSFGANYIDEQGSITIDKSPAVDALAFMVEMIRDLEIVDPSSVTLSQEAAADLFYKGSSAFFFQGPPVTFTYANDPEYSSVVGQVEAASWLPAAKPELQTTLTLPEAFAIPKGSQNKEAAWKFIEYMISPERDKERALALGSLPLFKELYEDDELLALYPYWEQFGEQSAKAKPLLQVEWYDELVHTTIVAVQKALLGMITPQEAAGEIADFLAQQEVNGVPLKR